MLKNIVAVGGSSQSSNEAFMANWMNVVNVILPVSELGNARIYHNAEFWILPIWIKKQKIHPCQPTQAIDISKST